MLGGIYGKDLIVCPSLPHELLDNMIGYSSCFGKHLDSGATSGSLAFLFNSSAYNPYDV